MTRTLRLLLWLALAATLMSPPAHAARLLRELSDFRQGLGGWTATGTAWGVVGTKRAGGSSPHAESLAGGEVATGTLRSPDFTVDGDLLQFRANGWDGREGGKGVNAYLLRDAADGTVLRRTSPPHQDGFQTVTWMVSDLQGRKAYFEAVDEDTGSAFAWLGLDRVRLLRTDVAGADSHLCAVPVASLNTWQILRRNGAGQAVPPYLSSLGLGEEGTGAVVSPAFVIAGPTVRLTLRGWTGPQGERYANFVQLLDAASGQVLRESPPPLSDDLKPLAWDVGDLQGRRVRIRLVDHDSNSAFAWIGLGSVDAAPSYSVHFETAKGLAGWQPEEVTANYHEAAGIPFLSNGGGAVVRSGGRYVVPLNLRARRLYLCGLTGTYDQGCPGWGDPADHSRQIFLGDRLGTLVLDYADGRADRYPLIYGYSAWWLRPIQNAPEPFRSDPAARRILAQSLHLYPTGAGGDGAYLAVLTPRAVPLRDIRIEDNPQKAGTPVLTALTVESDGPTAGLQPLPYDRPPPTAALWLAAHPLQSDCLQDRKVREALSRLRGVLYTTPADFPRALPVSVPRGYHGPQVRFTGTVYADILTSLFYANVQDVLDKITPDGMYHTSTRAAPSWGGYEGMGTWRDGVGTYYGHSWTRDMGRSLQEATELGFLDKAARCADYCFREARLWEDPSVRYKGVQLPPHWCRIANIPQPQLGNGVFENDGHGLTMLFTYKLWQRLPGRNAWLRRHWADVQAAGDWPGWQLDHPDISGASDVLMTDSECAGGIGKAKYADFLCREALLAYAEMADSIGQSEAARRWRATAARLTAGMEREYFTQDRWGPNWTLDPAGWPNKSTNLGPLIILADRRGFAPADDNPAWRTRNVNAYRRLTASYQPFGYYWVTCHGRGLSGAERVD
ncbi:MAG: hypothetical protein JO250_24145 [Armatimonadetes bacterium]|nr:hypothetical protein [Armatimonadota bacterium]